MNRRSSGGRPHRPPKPGNRPAPRPPRRRREPENDEGGFRIVERKPAPDPADTPFRVLIAVHRPRFRGRAERAADLEGWEVTALLNKQDPVGQCARPPRPPDLLVLSCDFGRQRDLAIFRAVQRWREQGMTLIGLVEDCETAPEGYPDSVPSRLCDVCVPLPCTATGLRTLFARLYEEKRHEPAPPPRSRTLVEEDEDE